LLRAETLLRFLAAGWWSVNGRIAMEACSLQVRGSGTLVLRTGAEAMSAGSRFRGGAMQLCNGGSVGANSDGGGRRRSAGADEDGGSRWRRLDACCRCSDGVGVLFPACGAVVVLMVAALYSGMWRKMRGGALQLRRGAAVRGASRWSETVLLQICGGTVVAG